MNLEDVRPGIKVRTNKNLNESRGMFVHQKHLKARRPDSEGVVTRHIPGHGGDCWWIKHGDAPNGSDIGAYCFDEFEPVQQEKRKISDYQKREEQCLYEELKHAYPEFAIPDERTREEKRRDAEQDTIDLFGPEEKKKG